MHTFKTINENKKNFLLYFQCFIVNTGSSIVNFGLNIGLNIAFNVRFNIGFKSKVKCLHVYV